LVLYEPNDEAYRSLFILLNMPDTFSHIAIPALFSRFFKNPLSSPMVLIGAVLPDYLREFIKFMFPASLFPAVYPFHSLLGIFCVSLFASSLFVKSFRRSIFISLIIGQLVHLIFDLFQFYLNGGQLYLLLPYWKSYQIGIYSDTYWIYVFLVSLMSFTIYCLLYFKRRTTTNISKKY
jgi:hypothetical protein